MIENGASLLIKNDQNENSIYYLKDGLIENLNLWIWII